jgi:uncharacterized membrane protein
MASDTDGDAAISIRIIGIEMIILGVVLMAITSTELSVGSALVVTGGLVGVGLVFIALSFVGTAKYRVTESTRYPQQTGDFDSIFLQLFGEKYLWFRIVTGVIWVILFALLVRFG